MNYVSWLEEVSRYNLESVGAKAANLGELIKLHIPIPKGYVLKANAYKDFLYNTGIIDKIKPLLDSIDYKDIKSIERTHLSISEVFSKILIPKAITDEVIKYYKVLREKNHHVAIRSSSIAEDLPQSSFAGIHETYLYVSEDEFMECIKGCWLSLFTPRALIYRQTRNIKHEDASMAVIVQSMINSEKSGVIFTYHPITRNPEQMIIESVWGLGEALVSGSVTPDHYVVNKNLCKTIHRIISNKRVKVVYDFYKGKGTKMEEIPKDLANSESLSDSEIYNLCKMAKRIEEYFKHPQDIEWCIEENKIYILQSRPITTL
ncbi:MAG: PEP/pyruvate-binding domain-containing protein [Nitrososphaerales archaeon]